ncbi:MAG: beta-lactamase family protein [Anaerolineae bacterium]|nr:beta-lactamase family protein [Anaerolineae bacterium]MCO5195371.1 beta-lactamase family protein [Anaerolineae bacterium]
MKTAIRWTAVAIVGLIVVVAVWVVLAYPLEYTQRVLSWGFADVYDYQKFPERSMPAADDAFEFEHTASETAIKAQFEKSAVTNGDLDTFLTDTGTQAFIVIQDDTILYENYFNGASRDSIVTSFSMAKSFASTLIGIAIEEGHINSVDDPITDYLPELAERDLAFAQITIRDLLMMSSGIRYAEFPFLNGDDSKTYYYPDLRDLALNQTKINGVPGEAFLYNNYHPLLLGMILERATGRSVATYLAQKIWQPMGAEFDGSWSLDENGFEKMESGINGRAIDFAKFGRLLLNEGNWDGEQIVSAEWVREATQPAIGLPDDYYSKGFYEFNPNGYYKYMWWGKYRDGEPNDFTAAGNYGQFIYVSPHKNLIFVRHGEEYGVHESEWTNLFYDFASGFSGGES